ncbi:MAG TPA: TolC family protein [Cytophagales bacterium]|nr:TolC family protein [Cytophagales bacterium]
MVKNFLRVSILLFFVFSQTSKAQEANVDLKDSLTLQECIDFSLSNRPLIRQASVDEAIGDREVAIGLADWFPQISLNAGVSYNIKLQRQLIGDQLITLGRKYNSNALFQVNQNIFNNELLLASKAAKFSKLQYDQNIENVKIATVVEVSKAFYDILLTHEQLRILDENIVRLEKQYRDAVSQFESGIVDKTDYQRASITLSSTRSDRKRTAESLKAKNAFLKELLGFPLDAPLKLSYDYTVIEQEISLDTAQELQYSNRIEYQQLQNQRKLLDLNTSYFQTELAPTLSAFYNHNFIYFNNEPYDLYDQAFPTSVVGLQLAFPIFQGTKRLQNIKIAKLRERRADIDLENIARSINTEYQTALANYKSEFNDYLTLKENLTLAEEVYDVIKLQYDEGIKAYLELIVAESDLRTAQLNYYNALYRVMSSKLDYERALGNIDVN